MTNFEKWKNSLRPDDLILDNGNDVDEEDSRFVAGIHCEVCPAGEFCVLRKDFWTDCGDIFKEWANQEAK